MLKLLTWPLNGRHVMQGWYIYFSYFLVAKSSDKTCEKRKSTWEKSDRNMSLLCFLLRRDCRCWWLLCSIHPYIFYLSGLQDWFVWPQVCLVSIWVVLQKLCRWCSKIHRLYSWANYAGGRWWDNLVIPLWNLYHVKNTEVQM